MTLWPAPAALLGVLVLGLGACSHGGGLAGRASSAPAGNVRVKGSPEYRASALSALGRLAGTRAGRRLLRELADTGREVTLRYGKLDLSGGTAIPVGDGDSVILWDPGLELPGFPAFLALHHELLHALHEAQGLDRSHADEEAAAIGTGRFASSAVSENALRRELGLSPRLGHESLAAWLAAHGKRAP